MKKTHLARNLRKRRNQLGWTQERCALEISIAANKDVGLSNYQAWEQGRANPRIEMLVVISEVFQIDDLYLFIKKEG